MVNVEKGKQGFQPVPAKPEATTRTLTPTAGPVLDPYTGDDLTAMYHGTNAPEGALERDGLVPMDGLSDEGMLGDGVTEAVFLTPDPHEAAEYGTRLLRVDISGLNYERVDGPDGWHYVVTETIEPERFRTAGQDDLEAFDNA